ncbi:MAG: hypothetical protein V4719_23110 [Planctomycetota bacterium]
MDYNIAYHLHCEVKMKSGRQIILEQLDQIQTYAGLIEGVPSSAINDLDIEHAVEVAKNNFFEGSLPFLIPPNRRDYLRQSGDMDNVRGVRGSTPEWLPMVRCIGTFKCSLPVRDSKMHGSALIVVWCPDSAADCGN